ncbi:MAG: hypothetical protein LBK06_02620 [Planctomycetaceae bacterium]|nr:hypothetical protein [Planctomycetaceae bacterium]
MCKTMMYAETVLNFTKLNTQSQQREAVVQGRSLLSYRFRYYSCAMISVGSSIVLSI